MYIRKVRLTLTTTEAEALHAALQWIDAGGGLELLETWPARTGTALTRAATKLQTAMLKTDAANAAKVDIGRPR